MDSDNQQMQQNQLQQDSTSKQPQIANQQDVIISKPTDREDQNEQVDQQYGPHGSSLVGEFERAMPDRDDDPTEQHTGSRTNSLLE